MNRSMSLLSCASFLFVLAGCGSNGDSSSSNTGASTTGGGSTTGSGGGGGSTTGGGTTTGGGSTTTGAGGGGDCTGTGGMCAAPFTAPPAGVPGPDCAGKTELKSEANITLTKACSPYHVTGTVGLSGKVVIEAGVHIQLGGGAHLTILDNGQAPAAAVDMNGTACDPVVFEPDSTGAPFGHVEIGSGVPGAGDSHLHYVELHGGGAVDALDALLFLSGKAPVLLDHINLIDSKHYGLRLRHEAVLAEGSNPIFIDKTPDGPALLETPTSLGTLPTLDLGCDPGPGISLETGDVPHSMTWATQPVPLLFPNVALYVHSDSLKEAVLTIAAPNKLLFGQQSSLHVGGNQGVPTNLVANGDITFDELYAGKGWKGLYLDTSADNGTVIKGGTIAHAGALQPMLTFDGKQAFGSVILNMSHPFWPDIEGETIRDANPAPLGAVNESACMMIRALGTSTGTEPTYEKQNTFTNCGAVNVAHSDNFTP